METIGRKSLEFARRLHESLNNKLPLDPVFLDQDYERLIDRTAMTFLVGYHIYLLCKQEEGRTMMMEREYDGGRIDFSVISNRPKNTILADIEHENRPSEIRMRAGKKMTALKKSLLNLSDRSVNSKILITYTSKEISSSKLKEEVRKHCKKHNMRIFLIWGEEDPKELTYHIDTIEPISQP